MTKRFNIKAAFEEAQAMQLEVDKEAAMSPEEKAIRDEAMQKAPTTDESGAPVVDGVDTPAVEPDEMNQDPATTPAVDAPASEPVVDEPVTTTDEPATDPATVVEETTTAEDKSAEGDAATTDTPALDPESEEGKAKAAEDEAAKEQEEEADTVATGLESISGVLTRSLDKGGLTPMAAGATKLILEQLYERVGMTYVASTFPAMESYSSISNRRQNTEMVLNNVTAAASKVREAIKRSAAKRAS
jgi:hypothetical protein